LVELPGSDEHPPSVESQFDSILVFWDFWADSNRRKEKFQVIVSD